MTTDELMHRAEERLNKTGNPALPPEETLSAILELGKEKAEANARVRDLEERIREYASQIAIAENLRDDAETERRKADDVAKEQAWVSHEFGKFICDVSNGIYAGQEMAAAKRVYDLNSGSIKKKRLNAYNFDSLDEAKMAYLKHSGSKDAPFNADKMLEWLFDYAVRP